MVEELTCKRDAGDRATRNSSNLSYHILRLERIKNFEHSRYVPNKQSQDGCSY